MKSNVCGKYNEKGLLAVTFEIRPRGFEPLTFGSGGDVALARCFCAALSGLVTSLHPNKIDFRDTSEYRSRQFVFGGGCMEHGTNSVHTRYFGNLNTFCGAVGFKQQREFKIASNRAALSLSAFLYSALNRKLPIARDFVPSEKTLSRSEIGNSQHKKFLRTEYSPSGFQLRTAQKSIKSFAPEALVTVAPQFSGPSEVSYRNSAGMNKRMKKPLNMRIPFGGSHSSAADDGTRTLGGSIGEKYQPTIETEAIAKTAIASKRTFIATLDNIVSVIVSLLLAGTNGQTRIVLGWRGLAPNLVQISYKRNQGSEK